LHLPPQLNVRQEDEKVNSAMGRKKRSSFVLEGSMAMMLAHTSTVDFVGQVFNHSIISLSLITSFDAPTICHPNYRNNVDALK
jgi:hypothetical protein